LRAIPTMAARGAAHRPDWRGPCNRPMQEVLQYRNSGRLRQACRHYFLMGTCPSPPSRIRSACVSEWVGANLIRDSSKRNLAIQATTRQHRVHRWNRRAWHAPASYPPGPRIYIAPSTRARPCKAMQYWKHRHPARSRPDQAR